MAQKLQSGTKITKRRITCINVCVSNYQID